MENIFDNPRLQGLRDKLSSQWEKLRILRYTLWSWLLNKAKLKWRAWLICGLIILSLFVLAWQFGPSIIWNAKLVKSLPSKCDSVDISDLAKCTEITRNFGWLLWMLFSATGVGFGLWLTWLGRQIQDKQWDTQHKSHLQERFEKATEMLGSDVELVRIGGCRSLMNLGINETSMKSACASLLFDFISNPPLTDDEKGKNFDELFPTDEALRSDIQSAIDSFSAIYKHYSERDIDVDVKDIKLPNYFWKNKMKSNICLMRANLQDADLQGAELQAVDLRKANLRGANLQEANLYGASLYGADLNNVNLRDSSLRGANLQWANLEESNLHRADLFLANLCGAELLLAELLDANLQFADLDKAHLSEADISWAKMRHAINLTKEQIWSAKWGRDEEGRGEPPQLPTDFEQDEDIKEWKENPEYDKEKELENPEYF